MKRLGKGAAAGVAAVAAGILLTGCAATHLPFDDSIQTVYGPPPAAVAEHESLADAETPASPTETARL